MTGETTEAALSQDEIIRQTKAIVQGLDSLRADHVQTLASLQSNNKVDSSDNSVPTDDRISAVTKSLEQLELGIGEAQVLYYSS
jgi:kinesin light chain